MSGVMSFPPVIRRKWLWGLVVLMAIPLINFPILLLFIDTLDLWIYIIIVMSFLTSMAVLTALLISGKKLVRQARTHDFFLCIHCGYVLEGLPEASTCPECGMSYTHEECQGKWQPFCGKWHKG